MLNIILFTTTVLLSTTVAFAQIPQDAISYKYDDSGNRIARKIPTIVLNQLPQQGQTTVAAKSMRGPKSPDANEATSEEPYVEEVRNLQYQIYPNPTVDYCMVDIKNLPEELSSTSLELYSVSGKMISQQKGITSQNRVNLSTVPGGMYILRVVVNGQATSFKIVKK